MPNAHGAPWPSRPGTEAADGWRGYPSHAGASGHFSSPLPPVPSPRDPPQMGDQSFVVWRTDRRAKKNTANSAASRPQTGADPPFRLCSRGAARPARDPPQDTNDPLIAMTCLKDLNVGDLTDVGMRGIPPQASLARLVSIQPLPWPATNHAECRPMHAVGRSS